MGEIVGRTITKAVGCGDHQFLVTLDNGVELLALTKLNGSLAPPVTPTAPVPPPMPRKKSIYDFKVGDRVKLVNLRPHKLIGATGTVKSLGNTRLHIQMDTNPAWGERWSGKVATAKPDIVEKI